MSALTNQVIHVLNRFDPMGLEPGNDGGPPWNEYEPEARELAAVLYSTGTITGEQVNSIWKRWFGVGTESAEAIASTLRSAAPKQPR